LTSWEDKEIRCPKGYGNRRRAPAGDFIKAGRLMSYRTYTDKDVPERISCEDALRVLVEEFVSPRERVRRILAGVEELIREGLSKGISRQRLLKLINGSEEMKDRTKISPSQFARYCREHFPGKNATGKAVRNDNAIGVRRNDGFGEEISERIERRGKV
jgi:hypothetical protein